MYVRMNRQKSLLRLAAFAVVSALAFPYRCAAEVHTVVVRDPFLSPSFYPQHLTINEGDTVDWIWDDANMDEHDVRAGTTPDNPPTAYQNSFISPLGITNTSFSWTFDRDYLNLYPASGNSYQYYCEPHWSQGMTGTVTVNRIPKFLSSKLQSFEVVSSSEESGSGECDVELNGDEDTVTFSCTHTVPGATTMELRLGEVGSSGASICSFSATGGNANGSCSVSSGQVAEMWEGRAYLRLNSASYPNGALRGQIVQLGTTDIVSGEVSFGSGLAVVGAAISAGDSATASLLDGSYSLKDVPNGVYQLKGDKPGMQITANGGLLLVNGVNALFRNLTAVLDSGVGLGPDADGDCVSDAQENADGSDPNDPGSYQEHLRSPVYTLWNGHIGLRNVLELVNKSAVSLPLTIKLYDISGQLVHQQGLALGARQQQDFFIDLMPGFSVNSYGIVAIEFSAQYGDLLEGRMFYYRSAGASDEYEFAFGVPFVQPSCGSSYVSFNTYQPSLNPGESGNLVAQWLGVVNLHPSEAKGFTVRRYNENGEQIGNYHLVVGPLGRQDIEGGHQNPGTYRYGLNEIIPDDPTSPYISQLFRYGGNAPPTAAPSTYSFAFPLLGRAGTARAVYAPISNGAGGENWVEITSTGADTDEVRVQFYSNADGLQHNQTLNLPAYSQVHISASQYLAPGASGSVVVESKSGGPIIAQSMFYFRDGAGSIMSMYGSQSREALGLEMFGSYNRYINLVDWLRLFNTKNDTTSALLTVYNPSQAPYQATVVLGPHGGVDLGLHESQYLTQPNSYGIVQLTAENVGEIAADVLRLRPSAGGGVDFAAPTSVR